VDRSPGAIRSRFTRFPEGHVPAADQDAGLTRAGMAAEGGDEGLTRHWTRLPEGGHGGSATTGPLSLQAASGTAPECVNLTLGKTYFEWARLDSNQRPLACQAGPGVRRAHLKCAIDQ